MKRVISLGGACCLPCIFLVIQSSCFYDNIDVYIHPTVCTTAGKEGGSFVNDIIEALPGVVRS